MYEENYSVGETLKGIKGELNESDQLKLHSSLSIEI